MIPVIQHDWEWHSPPSTLGLPRHEVHLWRVSLDAAIAHLQEFTQILSPDEQSRASRFHFERDRQRFSVGRGMLRTILSRYLQIEPNELKFDYGAWGKPFLAEPFNPGQIRFNLSHSQGFALFAIARDREIGVDLERIRLMPSGDRLAARCFSAQENALLQTLSPEQWQNAFFCYWTCKEAYVKASGVGLAQPIQEIEVLLSETVRLLSVSGSRAAAEPWSLRLFTPAVGYVGALVVEGKDWELKCLGDEVRG